MAIRATTVRLIPGQHTCSCAAEQIGASRRMSKRPTPIRAIILAGRSQCPVLLLSLGLLMNRAAPGEATATRATTSMIPQAPPTFLQGWDWILVSPSRETAGLDIF